MRAAQTGTVARPRHQLFIWRGGNPDEPRERGLADAGAEGGEFGA